MSCVPFYLIFVYYSGTFDAETVIIPARAINMPTICISVSAIPVRTHVSIATMTALKLIIAEHGPVGPAARAWTTDTSAAT